MANADTDIVADSLLLLELALSIGRTSNESVNRRCKAFLHILLARKNLSYGSVWICSDVVSRDEGDAQTIELIAAFPESRGIERKISIDHPSMAVLKEPGFHVTRDTDPDFDLHVLEANFPGGSVLSLKLRNLGVMRLFSIKSNAFTRREINQLLPVIEIFALSLKSAYAQEHLQQSEMKARLATAEAERSRAVAERAQKSAELANKAKSEFLSTMSHELRTPLNAILGFGQVIEAASENGGDEATKVGAGYILRSGWHLLSLIEEVLDLSKIESGQFDISIDTISLTDIVGDCHQTVAAMAKEHGISIGNTLSPNQYVKADGTRLKQVFLNLLSNAIKYNRPDGTVTVGSEHPHEGFIRVTVADTGRGISPANVDKIYQPFERLSAANSEIDGTGIGLTITKRLIEAMGGRIGFDSVEGKGSSFWLDIPVDDAPAMVGEANLTPAIRGNTKPPSSVDENSKVILYIEDSPANLRLMEMTMSRFSTIRMLSAHTGEIGLQMAEAHHPDLILLDINLPDMNGFQILKRLRASPRQAAIPVIAVTANAMPADLERAALEGFDATITKPFNLDEIADVLHRGLGLEPSAALGKRHHEIRQP